MIILIPDVRDQIQYACDRMIFFLNVVKKILNCQRTNYQVTVNCLKTKIIVFLIASCIQCLYYI